MNAYWCLQMNHCPIQVNNLTYNVTVATILSIRQNKLCHFIYAIQSCFVDPECKVLFTGQICSKLDFVKKIAQYKNVNVLNKKGLRFRLAKPSRGFPDCRKFRSMHCQQSLDSMNALCIKMYKDHVIPCISFTWKMIYICILVEIRHFNLTIIMIIHAQRKTWPTKMTDKHIFLLMKTTDANRESPLS